MTSPASPETTCPGLPVDLRLWDVFLNTLPSPEADALVAVTGATWQDQPVCVFAKRKPGAVGPTYAALEARVAELEAALRQLKRGRECSASRGCIAPFGGDCTCGNAQLCRDIDAALSGGSGG
jgi:hypothetical protein